MIDDGDHAPFERSRLAASAAQHHEGPRSWFPEVLCTLLQNRRVDCLYSCGNLMSESAGLTPTGEGDTPRGRLARPGALIRIDNL
jgi:hypothetical protein